MKQLKIIFLILVIIVTGFVRDSLFIHLNAQTGVADGSYEQFDLPFAWSFIRGLSYADLIRLKWLFTLLFFIVYLGYSLVVTRWFFPSRRNYIITLGVFGFVFLLSAVSILIGYVMPAYANQCYYFSRWLMGAAQSPVLIMLLTLLFYAEKRGMLQKS
jgi:hypothetical protein